MGFMDKVKQAGASALKGALTAAAKSYGTVTEGKHKGCKVCINSETNEIAFIKIAVEEGRYCVRNDIQTFSLVEDKGGINYKIKIDFKNGESSYVLSDEALNKISELDVCTFLIELSSVPSVSNETAKWVNGKLEKSNISPVFEI